MKKRLIFTYRPLFYSLTIPFAALIITACGKSTTVPKAEATDTTRYALAQETGPGHDEARSLPPAEAEYAGKHYVMNVNITPCDSLPMVTDDFGDPFQDNIVECQITLDGNSIAHQRFTKADFADAVITADHIEELILGGMAFDIMGVALATLLSQIYGGVLGAYLIYLYGDFDYKGLPWGELLDWRQFIGMLQVNANLMIRTACLLTVNNIIAAVGASLGTVVLAANAVLLQLKDIMSYLIDGMANGAAIFSGKAVGSKDRQLFDETITMTYKWLLVLALVLMGGYYLTSTHCIRLFTSIQEVIAMAQTYELYVLFYPVCAGVGMVLYGVFCGATRTAPVRNMMLIALTVFYLLQHFLVPLWGNSGLWLALLGFMLTQSIVLTIFLKGLIKHIFY